jgi:predicted nucleic acid-binding protein
LIVQQALVVDTCVLITLLATDRLDEIALHVAPGLLVCSAVASESIYLRPLDVTQQPEQVILDPFFENKILAACDCDNDAEEELYVNYALELDDGEAMSLAIAHARKLPLATDEKKAKRVIRDSAKHMRVVSTSEILYAWATGRGRAEIKPVLEAIGIRARFRPPDDDPLVAWWNSFS